MIKTITITASIMLALLMVAPSAAADTTNLAATLAAYIPPKNAPPINWAPILMWFMPIVAAAICTAICIWGVISYRRHRRQRTLRHQRTLH